MLCLHGYVTALEPYSSKLHYFQKSTDSVLAQVQSLDQSTIRVIQDPIRCFLNRDPQADGKNGLVQYGPFDFQAHSFC